MQFIFLSVSISAATKYVPSRLQAVGIERVDKIILLA
jgi:hypothetical protein